MDNENKKLFVVNPTRPMKFSIYKGQMLNIKFHKLCKNILAHGGIVVDFNEKDSECIVLAEKSVSLDTDVFNVKYIRKCISKNKTLNLLDYWISGPAPLQNCNGTISFTRILTDEKCIHHKTNDYTNNHTGMTAEEILNITEQHLES